MTSNALELNHLAADPIEEWQRMLRFSGLSDADRSAMYKTVEALLERGRELVVDTYDYLRSVPETAAILKWETSVDQDHLEERRRFFTIWLTRTLAVDTSEEFAAYLFRAGKLHAGQGPRQIHTPPAFVTTSIGLVLASFARYMAEAKLPGEVIATAMSGWCKYLTVQLHQMLYGYQIALEFANGNFPVQVSLYGRMRPIVGASEITIQARSGSNVADVLSKFFNYYPQARAEALDRVWHSDEKSDSLWPELWRGYVPHHGWRVLLNGRDLNYEGGFQVPINENDRLSVFPPGR
jgi:molybdopterin converting factor small subunit